ncbi:hypothetical protein BOO69_03785 [Sulfitobacter alexandrii]|uniref:Uncharacterized protein n=1 Tax=Sulfitobacter alexandrii TaxID=1917485 RepID=A0A1J0WEQ9_9RHOB|nr:hypothetical protein [Sulfitobacter alexandrii]APE42638.1 hypothetical protein BOO69_03785 [Sulfitobacter alexandrii]
MNFIGSTLGALCGMLAVCIGAAAQELAFEEDGPFRPGEGFGTPATCETMPDWIDRAPDIGGRISMVIEGPITQSHWDGALAYLIMCDPQEVQVMCVTYYPQEVTGEPVQFAGGYNRAGERQIVLDPCLTYPVEGEPVGVD